MHEDKICFDCASFFPSTTEATGYGICLNDDDFEPYLDELLEMNYSSCRKLVERKKFPCDRQACEQYEEGVQIEIDDDSPLGRQLRTLSEGGEIDMEAFQDAVLEYEAGKIDFANVPTDRYEKMLNSPDPKENRDAISNLGGLIAFGNEKAYAVLLDHFRHLPPPKKLEEVHYKIELFRTVGRPDRDEILIPILVDELYKIVSNNTTRQWITQILKYLKTCPRDMVHPHFERMLGDSRYSYRFKKKLKDILSS